MLMANQCRLIRRILLFLTLALPVALGCTGCGSTDPLANRGRDASKDNGEAKAPADEPVSDLSGQIKVDGSSTVYPISAAVAEAFAVKYPKVNGTVNFLGTGGGFKLFTKGELDISDASRPITAEELDECEKNKVKFIELPIAYDGLTVVVHSKNDWVDQLTIDDLKKIYLEGGAKNWKEVNPDWPDRPIKTFGAGTASGTYDYFREVLGGKKVELRGDVSESENDNVLVTGVSGQKDAIGYFGAAYYFANKDELKAVKIVNPQGKAIAPAHDVIVSGEYAPLSRPLFIYVSENSLARRETQRFVSYYLDHAPELAEKAGSVALPKDVYERAKANFKDRVMGTHYLTEDGQKRSGPISEVYVRANLRAMK